MTDSIVKLFTEDGLSQSEIARRLGVTPQAIFVRLKRLGLSNKDRFISPEPLFEQLPPTRRLAKEQRSTHYFTGKECFHGHIAKRYTTTGQCIECTREFNKASWAVAAREKYGKSEKAKMTRANWVMPEKSRDKKRIRERTHFRHKYQTDPLFKIRKLLRCRQSEIFKKARRPGSFIRDLGCTLDECRKHIESHLNWKEHFTWDNHGKVWELDHVKALGLFDLTNREQFLQAAHYSNLQPLSVEEHRIKTVEDKLVMRTF